MPAKYIIKIYGAEQYYHVFSRGVARQRIFYDKHDYGYFLKLLKRYLSYKPEVRKKHPPYPSYGSRLDLIAFCLMPNHFHLFIFQYDARAMTECMHAVLTSYAVYFNKKYARVGPMCQSNYKARLIEEMDIASITRYIHRNPQRWVDYEYSSFQYYLSVKNAEWVRPAVVLASFKSTHEYQRFLIEYTRHEKSFDQVTF